MGEQDATQTDGGGGKEPRTGPDEARRITADEIRRRVIRELSECEHHHTTLSDLVDKVADALGEERRRVSLAIHHNHLPRLVDHGIVEYDERNGDIRYYPSPRVERLAYDSHVGGDE